MKKQFSGIGFYFIILAVIVILTYLTGRNATSSGLYSNADFMKDLESGEIVSVEIRQNEEIPTGRIFITMKDNSEKRLFVSDVNETEKVLDEYGVTWFLNDVSRQGWFMTSVFPILILSLIHI